MTDPKSKIQNPKFYRLLGTALALFGVAYTVLVITVVLPYFRGGIDVHFAQYFSDLGGSTGEIVRNAFTRSGLFLSKIFSVESTVFALALLMPVGFVSLMSPLRLAVGVPLFAVLCLNQISKMPVHHFHAPLVPIVFWSAAAGLGNVPRAWGALRHWWGRGSRIEDRMQQTDTVESRSSILNPQSSILVATWSLSCSLTLGLFLSLSPLGITFWDPHSSAHWRNLYVPGQRARLFPKVLAQVPPDTRVASTDFIHPRFTHHARSYDYSDYRPIVPADADFIVIDTHHPYSRIERPADVKELREHPEQWELMPDQTEGYFLVLRHRILPPNPTGF